MVEDKVAFGLHLMSTGVFVHYIEEILPHGESRKFTGQSSSAPCVPDCDLPMATEERQRCMLSSSGIVRLHSSSIPFILVTQYGVGF